MRNNRQQLNEDFWDTLGSAARSVAELPIIRNVVDFFSGLGENEDVQDKKEEIQRSIASLQDERVPLSKALEMDTDKIALVVGSSQAGVIGYPVMQELESRGFKNFKFNSTPSKSMNFIYAAVAAGIREKGSYDAIVIFPGFRGAENPDDVISIIELFEPARCFVVIPPPVTQITDVFRASRLGLNAGRQVPQDYWFIVGGGKFAGAREEFCKNLVEKVKSAGATPIDPRDVVIGGAEPLAEGIQPTGVSFPDSPDGIHPSDEVCQQIAKAVADSIFGCQLTVPSSDVIKHIKPVDLEKNPAIAQSLKDFPALSTILGTAAVIQDPEKSEAVFGRVSSGFGPRIDPISGKPAKHEGLDISVPVGTPVKAALAGQVINTVEDSPIAGKYVEIQHDNGDVTRYLHLSNINVKKGDNVETGQVIALSGGLKGAPGSGKSTGPHLHWETWEGAGFKKGKLSSPKDWLAKNTDAISPIRFS